jgi:hypothetical protein
MIYKESDNDINFRHVSKYGPDFQRIPFDLLLLEGI